MHNPPVAYETIFKIEKGSNQLSAHNKHLLSLTRGMYNLETCRYYEAYSDLSSAEKFFKDRNDTQDLVLSHLLLARLFKDGFSDLESSLDYLGKRDETLISKFPTLGYLIEFQRARIMLDKRNLEEAEYSAFEASEFFSKSLSFMHREYVAECRNLLGLVWLFRKDPDKAITLIREAIEIGEDQGINYQTGKYYDNLGVIYWTRDSALSKKYLINGLKINSEYPWNSYRISSSLLNLGSLFLFLKDYISASMYFHQSRSIKEKVFNPNHPEISVDYFHLALMHEESSHLDSAEHYYNKSFGIEQRKIIRSGSQSLMLGSNTLNFITFSGEVVLKRYNLLKKKYAKSKQEVSALKGAQDGFMFADSLLMMAQKSYEWEATKASLYRDYRRVYEDAVACQYNLYEATKESKYALQAVFFMERTKYALLADHLKKVKANASLNIPPEILNKERDIKKSIYVSQIVMASESISPNEYDENLKKIINWQDSLREISQSIEKIKPQYNLYNEISSHDFKGQGPFIEYFYASSDIYLVGVNGTKVFFDKIPITKELRQQLQEFYSFNSSLNFARGLSVERFKDCSFGIFEKLLAPALKNLSIQSNTILIVPDGPLMRMPWDALITSKAPEKNSYRNLPYLLHKYTIGQTFSLAVLSQMDKKDRIENGKYMALTFESKNSKSLIGAWQEVKSMASYLPVTLFHQDSSTKKSFFKHASMAEILHLSAHGIYDSSNWMNDAIVFSDYLKGDTLRILDLYDANLQTNLIVIGSCENALGSNFEGEGIMSFARAFTYAGAQSLIASLWRIPDHSTAKLFDRFYFHVSSDKNYATALQLSKVDYLNKADEITSMPYFWAGVTFIGSDEKQDKHNWGIILYSLILISTVLITYRLMHFHKIYC